MFALYYFSEEYGRLQILVNFGGACYMTSSHRPPPRSTRSNPAPPSTWSNPYPFKRSSLRVHLLAVFSADCKRGRRKGATSKNVKNRQKVSKSFFDTFRQFRSVPPCAVKTCAVRPVFARVVMELQAADPSNVHGPVKQNASPEAQSEAPRRGRKPGQGQNPGPENQDSQHMLEHPRGSFPDNFRAGQKTSKIVKKRQNVFRHFRQFSRGTILPALLGGSDF